MQQVMARVARFAFLVIFFFCFGAARADDAAPATPSAPTATGGEVAPAPAGPGSQEAPPPPAGLGSPWPLLVIMGVVMWFMVIRPQRKEEKAKKEMLSQLKKNDHVLTSGGLYGVVAAVTDADVVLKVDESKDVRVKVTRSSVAKVITEDGAAKDAK